MAMRRMGLNGLNRNMALVELKRNIDLSFATTMNVYRHSTPRTRMIPNVYSIQLTISHKIDWRIKNITHKKFKLTKAWWYIPVFTARNTAHEHGRHFGHPYLRPVNMGVRKMTPVFTGRVGHQCIAGVNTGRVYECPK